jgi:hypothetical protein
MMCQRKVDRATLTYRQTYLKVSSQKVGANPCGCPPGQVQNLPLPQDIEKIHLKTLAATASQHCAHRATMSRGVKGRVM